jgi:hypothetical protein
MKIDELKNYLERKGFKFNQRDKTYEKRVRELDKRYIISDNAVFVEQKFFNKKSYRLIALSDVRELYITDKDKIGGLKKYIPDM